MKTRHSCALACLTIFSVTGCDKDDGAVLAGKRWMLVQVDDFPLTLSSYGPTTQSCLEFNSDGKRTAGLGPCNAFSGEYTLGKNSQQLTISPQAPTRATCGGQNIEDRYLTALPLTVRFAIDGQELRLYDATAKPRLVFKRAAK